MKKMTLVLLTLSLVGLLAGCASGGAAAPKKVETEVTSNRTGMDGGYFFSYWTKGGGSVTMTLDGADGYRVRWANVDDFTCGKGWGKGSGHTVSYSGWFTTSGMGLFGIYGWTTDPLIEYYICDAWGEATNPATSGKLMGTVVSDDDTYDVYQFKQVNQPSINGTATFMQYKSFRRTPRTSGTVTVQNHFDGWAKLGMKLGSMHNYQILLSEGFNGSGSAGATVKEVSK